MSICISRLDAVNQQLESKNGNVHISQIYKSKLSIFSLKVLPIPLISYLSDPPGWLTCVTNQAVLIGAPSAAECWEFGRKSGYGIK